MEIKLKELLEAGCHFGHQTSRWNPKMKSYIFSARDNVHIFDLVKTKEGLEQTADFVKKLVAGGGKIIFVATKRQAKDIIKETAVKVGMPYVSEHWVGGTLTNWDQIKNNIKKLKDLKAKREAGELKDYTKKERLLIDREIAKLERHFGGIASLDNIPEALFIVDVKKEAGAAIEARQSGVKVLAIVDTNSNPDLVDYIIPANDDAVKSIEFIAGVIVQAIEEGRAGTVEKKEAKEKEKEPAEDKEVKVKKETKVKKIKTQGKKETK